MGQPIQSLAPDRNWRRFFPALPAVRGLRQEHLLTRPVIPGNIYVQRPPSRRGDAEISLAFTQPAEVRRFIQEHWYSPTLATIFGPRVVDASRILGSSTVRK